MMTRLLTVPSRRCRYRQCQRASITDLMVIITIFVLPLPQPVRVILLRHRVYSLSTHHPPPGTQARIF